MSKESISFIADCLLNNKIQKGLEVLPLMRLVTPTFYLVVYEDKLYFVYLLQDRKIVASRNAFEIQELLLVETTEETLKSVLAAELSIYGALEQSESKYWVGKVGATVFPLHEVVNMDEIGNRVPKKDYYLELDETLVSVILNGFERLLTNLEKDVE